jgi:hypothetical protein
VKLPHGYTRSVAVVRLSDAAFRLHFAALDWCGEQGTDGRIYEADLPALPMVPTGRRLVGAVSELVAVGLWSPRFLVDVNIWQLADAPRADSGLSEKRAEAGRRGGLKAGESRRANAIQEPEEVKLRARQLMARAISRGELLREPCSVCGNQESQGHHTDYSKPLEVVWLCSQHHTEEHTRLRTEQASKLLQPTEQKRSNLLQPNEANATDPSSPLVLPSPDSLSGSDSSLSQADPAELPESFSLVGAPAAKKVRRKALWHTVPAEWEPSPEHVKIARDRGVDFVNELAKFRDHEFGVARSDANRAFRNWLRRASPERTGPNQPPPPGFIDHNRRPESRRLDLPERRGGVGLAFGGTKT